MFSCTEGSVNTAESNPLAPGSWSSARRKPVRKSVITAVGIPLEALVAELGQGRFLYALAAARRQCGNDGLAVLEEPVHRADGHSRVPSDRIHGRRFHPDVVEECTGGREDRVERDLAASLLRGRPDGRFRGHGCAAFPCERPDVSIPSCLGTSREAGPDREERPGHPRSDKTRGYPHIRLRTRGPSRFSADDRLRPPASGQRGGSATKLTGSWQSWLRNPLTMSAGFVRPSIGGCSRLGFEK